MANRGEGLEKYVLDRMRADGFLLMGKTDPPVRVLRYLPNNQFKGVYLQEGPLDLTGPADGYHCEIEVKDCKGMRWYFTKLRAHQYERMKNLHADGSLSGLALRLRGASANDDFVFFVPSAEVIRVKEAGAKSLHLNLLSQMESEGRAVRHEYRRTGDVKLFLEKIKEGLDVPVE